MPAARAECLLADLLGGMAWLSQDTPGLTPQLLPRAAEAALVQPQLSLRFLNCDTPTSCLAKLLHVFALS